MTLPPIGSFLKPVGTERLHWSMCVTHHWGDDAIGYERWGLKDGRVIDDGRVAPGYVAGNLVQTPIPGVWRDSFDFGGHQRWSCCPLYYRAISGPTGQGDLFV